MRLVFEVVSLPKQVREHCFPSGAAPNLESEPKLPSQNLRSRTARDARGGRRLYAPNDR